MPLEHWRQHCRRHNLKMHSVVERNCRLTVCLPPTLKFYSVCYNIGRINSDAIFILIASGLNSSPEHRLICPFADISHSFRPLAKNRNSWKVCLLFAASPNWPVNSDNCKCRYRHLCSEVYLISGSWVSLPISTTLFILNYTPFLFSVFVDDDVMSSLHRQEILILLFNSTGNSVLAFKFHYNIVTLEFLFDWISKFSHSPSIYFVDFSVRCNNCLDLLNCSFSFPLLK